MKRIRIHFAGVGGQGTLTATTLLSKAALDEGLDVVSGEIHGMAQRGGVVESTLLLGGWQSPVISHGEADIVLGFEALETYRAVPYLAREGSVLSSTDFVPPPGVSAGREVCPPLEEIKKVVSGCAKQAWFVPCQELGLKAGSIQCANTVLLGALAATGLLPFGPDALKKAIGRHLPEKLVAMNAAAVDFGVAAIA
ncbi:Pyruvate/ketoisovalerate oxidoreductase, catalytic domain protein [uncultured delta proteobacterium]|uniref:Pyruvate/ketoisovalerate oxidoreductase, catalytic domain protein n=1 Tax=uncultured delta proteobacterium TaxID=34034 RepID=A0A212ITH4_9DELT|nr:Pyruvate/ketoisovalerate oxidoreductase, catalytic domain protein [uncultured delta proteobacterium]